MGAQYSVHKKVNIKILNNQSYDNSNFMKIRYESPEEFDGITKDVLA